MIVPYFECQYPQVVPFSDAQFQAIVNSAGANGAGMGDYLDPFGWPIPQYLTPGNNRGLGCACGGSCCGGLGLFDSMDPTTWGAAEYGVMAAGVFVLYTLVHAINGVERGYRKTTGAVGKKVRKTKSAIRKKKEAAKTLFSF